MSLLAASSTHTYNKFTELIFLPSLASLGRIDGGKYDYSVPIMVTYTNDPSSAHEWKNKHLKSFNTTTDEPKIQFVGFDLESAPDLPWRKDVRYVGPATIQLAVVDAALIIQIAQDDCGGPLEEMLPFVHSILDDNSILLAGVGMNQDMVELYRWIGNKDGSLVPDRPLRVDLGGIGSTNGESVGLRRLAAGVLRVDTPKSKKLARSPWATVPLSIKSIAYAARDAWTSAAVLHRLHSLDPERFSPNALRDVVRKEEEFLQSIGKPLSIADLSAQMILRKQYRDEWTELKEKKKERRLSEEEIQHMKRLKELVHNLGPPKPVTFEVKELSLLGIII
ncbi:3'-5' exonuclease [Nitzschia inconspicua]|uniref:3'-5' exonuclease n=1 Tax=Nitzschia inconspicua TaxID=303405 RepID=A0A9K3LNE3_9STRA|nr:3'-5' exonuclease [Nitzschia inconspicua]